jgi:hypothetical protein
MLNVRLIVRVRMITIFAMRDMKVMTMTTKNVKDVKKDTQCRI